MKTGILVQEEDGHRCLEALKQAGYVTIQDYTVDEFVDMKSQNHFNPLFRNGVMVEIHIRLQNTREIYQQNLKEVWRDAVIMNETEHAPSVRGTLRLELSDMLIHACLHLDKHFVTSHVQFTSFNDLFNLLREIEERTKNQEPRIKTEEIADFWQRFEAKCIKYNFADTVFRYLVMVRYFYGAPTSGTATHLLHLKALKNPVDFMRYVWEVVFPGKEFMVEKYNINGKWLMINGKFWWLWYPYRYYCGLRGLFKVVND